ncbi:MAG: dihydrofolate reductase [Ignavibacteriaceae bacterium]
MKKIIISAVAKNGVIGRSNGEMPWHVKEEFQHFKNTTLGFPILMGRKSFDTLGKPLKGRLNVVITNNPDYKVPFEEVKIFHSLHKAVDYFDSLNQDKVFIIGGGQIYEQAIGFADEMIISIMDFEAEGDVLFPQFDKSKWNIVKKDKREQFEIIYYERKEV